MSEDQRRPGCDDVVAAMGRAGLAIAAIGAAEGAAGNLSVRVAWSIEVRDRFPNGEPLPLPDPVPALAGHTVFVSGSGRRLREIASEPEANLGALTIGAAGREAILWTARSRRFERLTSELNSHLAVHADQVELTGAPHTALVHAQPPRLTMLSHLPEYREGDTMSRRLWRWEPETIVNLPEGIAVLPYLLPGSAKLMAASVAAMRSHRLVVWSKHGVLARSDASVTRAVDLIEYAETAAHYEHLNLATGERADGLTESELAEIVEAFGLDRAWKRGVD